MSGIQDLGNGFGWIYLTKVDGTTIIGNQPNTPAAVSQMRAAGNVVAPVSGSRSAWAKITITAINGSGSATSLSVNGIDQLGANVVVTGLTSDQAAALISAQLQLYMPTAGYNYTSSCVNNIIYLFGPPSAGSSINGLLPILSSTGSPAIVYTATAFQNGASDNGIFDQSVGKRFFLNADYGPSGIPNTLPASPTSLAGAIEISKFIISRGLQTALFAIDATLADYKLPTIERVSAITNIYVTPQSGNSGTLIYINPTDFVDGDIVFVRTAKSTSIGTNNFAITVESADNLSVPGVGNIYLTDGIAYAANARKVIQLQYNNDTVLGPSFTEVSRSEITPAGSGGDMTKAEFATATFGLVQNSQRLNGRDLPWVIDRANHTGVQDQNTIINLINDLLSKVNVSDIGVTVASLFGGVIPMNQLPFLVTSYKGLYDGSTNVPLLTNGIGTSGWFYITSVAGSAGPATVVAAQIIAYNGSIWQAGPIFTGGISQITTAFGILVGPSPTLDSTKHFNNSTNKNFVNDAQLAAFPSGASASDPLVKLSQLTTTVVGNSFFMAELFSDGHTLGMGTIRMLSTLTNPTTGVAYTNLSAGSKWPRVNSNYTMDVTTMDIDWICHQEAMLTMWLQGYTTLWSPGGRGYCPSRTLSLPLDQIANLTRASLSFSFKNNGSRWANFTGNDLILFKRYFTNQTQCDGANSYLQSYAYHFHDYFLQGNGGNSFNDIAFQLGATNHSTFNNIETNDFGVPIDLEFCLEALLTNIKHVSYGLYGSYIASGRWTGASSAVAGSNVLNIRGHRNVCVAGGKTPTAGIFTGGNGSIELDTLTFEGNSGSIHHYLHENPGAFGQESVVRLRNLYFEAAGASRSAIKFKADKGDFFVDKWNNTVPYADMPVFIEVEHVSPPPSGVRQLYIQAINAVTQQGNGGLPKFRAVTQQPIGYGHFFDVRDVNMPNNATLNTAANFDTSVANSYIPLNNQVNFVPAPI